MKKLILALAFIQCNAHAEVLSPRRSNLGLNHRFENPYQMPPMTRYYQKKNPLYKAYRDPKVPEKRRFDYSRWEYTRPDFPVASKNCHKVFREHKEVHGGNVRFTRAGWEPICGYKEPPESVQAYNYRVSPYKSKRQPVKKIFRRRRALAPYSVRYR